VGSSEQVQVSLSGEQTRALLTEVGPAYHAQLQDVLLAGLALGYARWSGESQLRVAVEGHGREQEVVGEVDVSRTVGWFTTIYPVLLEVAAGAAAGAAVKRVKEQVRRVPGAGLGYGVLRWLSAGGGALAGAQEAEVSFNYLGQLDQVLTGSGLFLGLAPESSGSDRPGEERREYVLEVGGSVVGGRLQLHAAYSGQVLRRERVEELLQQVKQVLVDVIDQRADAHADSFTPSDFPEAELSQEDLDQLVAELSEVTCI
jgi:non-ribosomal peptide synthase protein (TIGR01720 family)